MSDLDSANRGNPIPSHIGRYRIEGILGRGSMGLVYHAFDDSIERHVALKTVQEELLGAAGSVDWRARFRREAQAAARCQHPNIVTIYEYGEHEGLPFIAMELIRGRTLHDCMARGEWPSVVSSLDIVRQTLDAIGYAHERGIIHRDLKPGNIMLLDDGEVKVTDFGIARLDHASITRHGAMIGTPGYMAIEQFNTGPVDGRADLFSIGVILYQLLTGRMPFPGDTVPVIVYQMLTGVPAEPRVLNPALSDALSQTVMRAIAREPQMRFQTAEEFRGELFARNRTSTTASMPVAPQPTIAHGSLPRPTPRVRSTPPPSFREPTSRQGHRTPHPGASLPGPRSGAGGGGPLADADLQRVTKELARVLGPIAGVLVRRHAANVASLPELYRALADHITNDRERSAFLRGAPRL